ncbi:hypothetical protein AVEN_136856-1 [Araneus ventricosus]|uniref:Uncharacterized protein n=1 Tax=Araneus ventricosus TaxID=182803 RepID=A0A4Y2G1W7_ARAVE|nr:hypothetical protein AVEN_136856-1 [Araneus ventricosus]
MFEKYTRKFRGGPSRWLFLYILQQVQVARPDFAFSTYYGDIALQERQCQRYVTKITAGNFYLNDAPRSGRPTEIDDDTIKALIESNHRYTTRKIAETLNIHH